MDRRLTTMMLMGSSWNVLFAGNQLQPPDSHLIWKNVWVSAETDAQRGWVSESLSKLIIFRSNSKIADEIFDPTVERASHSEASFAEDDIHEEVEIKTKSTSI